MTPVFRKYKAAVDYNPSMISIYMPIWVKVSWGVVHLGNHKIIGSDGRLHATETAVRDFSVKKLISLWFSFRGKMGQR